MHNSIFCNNIFFLIFILISSTWQQLNTAYLESHTSFDIYNLSRDTIIVSCYEKRRDEPGQPRMVYFGTKYLEMNTYWQAKYGLSLFEDMLYCAFEAITRRWNCHEVHNIESMCVWESVQSLMLRNSLSLPNNDACPVCDRSRVGPNMFCEWVIHEDGLYISEYNLVEDGHFHNKKVGWGENQDPDHTDVDDFNIAIINELDDDVKITIVLLNNEATFSESIPSRFTRIPPNEPIWKKTFNVHTQTHLVSTWICDFEVDETRAFKMGVNIWTPPEANKDPNCIDCEWKLNDNGIWLNIMGCNDQGPNWVKKYDWIITSKEYKGKTIGGPSKRPRYNSDGSLDSLDEYTSSDGSSSSSKRPKTLECDN